MSETTILYISRDQLENAVIESNNFKILAENNFIKAIELLEEFAFKTSQHESSLLRNTKNFLADVQKQWDER